jgi:hypothetical protein
METRPKNHTTEESIQLILYDFWYNFTHYLHPLGRIDLTKLDYLN